MFAEKAERRSAAPISSAIEWRRFLKISSSAASIFTVTLQAQVEMFVHSACKIGRDDGSRAVFGDHPGTLELNASRKRLTRVKSSGKQALVEPDGFQPQWSWQLGGRDQARRACLGLRNRNRQSHAQRDHFARAPGVKVAVGA